MRHRFGSLRIYMGVAIIVVFIAMAYRDKIERLLRKWHIMKYRQHKARRAEQKKKYAEGMIMLRDLGPKKRFGLLLIAI